MSLLLTLASSGLPIAFIQQKPGTTADASGTFMTTLDAPVKSGNSVVVQLSLTTTLLLDAAPTFNGDAMVEAISNGGIGLPTVSLYYLHNVAGGTNTVFSVDIAGRCNVNVSEWQGLPNVVPEDTNIGSAVANANMIVVPSVDPVTANNLSIGIGAYSNAVAAYSSGPNNGFTRMTNTGGASIFQECAHLIRTNDASATSDSTIVLSSALDWVSCSAVFRGL